MKDRKLVIVNFLFLWMKQGLCINIVKAIALELFIYYLI